MIMRPQPDQVGKSYPKNSCAPDMHMWQSQQNELLEQMAHSPNSHKLCYSW